MTAEAYSRRIKVKGRRSIYYRQDARGRRRYEFTYRDSDGRQRWKVVAGGLEDAQAALEEVRGRLRRGERVAPTRLTFAEVAEDWLATKGELRPRSRESYEWAFRVHLFPRLGKRRIADITDDDVARFLAEMRQRQYTGYTVRSVMTPLRGALGYAARRGLIGSNPCDRLERGERPRADRRQMRVLRREEIAALLEAAGACKPLLATALFTGLRLGELLGLTWANVDFDAGVVRVRRQLDRNGKRVEPKTPEARRDVVMMPALGRILREHRLRSPFTEDADPVFASSVGTPIRHGKPIQRILWPTLERAGLNRPDTPRLRWHELRHTFASLLIAQGGDVVFVSRQLGHSSPNVTLNVYAHQFDAAQHAQRASAALEASFGSLLDGNAVVTGAGNGTQGRDAVDGANVRFLR